MPSKISGPVLPIPLSKIYLPGITHTKTPLPRETAFAKNHLGKLLGFSSLGEFCDLPGLLLLLRLVARSRLRFWSWRRDLNPRPSDYKSDALPAELRQRAALFGLRPDKQTPPCLPGQLSRVAQGTSPCNRPSIRPNLLKRLIIASELGLHSPLPPSPKAGDFAERVCPRQTLKKRSLPSYSNSGYFGQFALGGAPL